MPIQELYLLCNMNVKCKTPTEFLAHNAKTYKMESAEIGGGGRESFER